MAKIAQKSGSVYGLAGKRGKFSHPSLANGLADRPFIRKSFKSEDFLQDQPHRSCCRWLDEESRVEFDLESGFSMLLVAGRDGSIGEVINGAARGWGEMSPI